MISGKLLQEKQFVVCWNLDDVGYYLGVCFLSVVFYFVWYI
jgi:hypothetical protein